MRHRAPDPGLLKTWVYDLLFAVDYTKYRAEQTHMHPQFHEFCRTTAAHGFRHSSPDDLHFIGHAPGLALRAARQKKTAAARERLA